MSEHQQQYKDHTITFNPATWTFIIAGPLVSADDLSVPSLKAAQMKIDKLTDADIVSKRVKLSIMLLNERGDPVTLTGFHGKHYRMLGIGGALHLYPNVEWLRRALRKYRDLEIQMDHLSSKLQQYNIRIGARYGTESLEQRYSDCVAEIATKTAAAEAAAAKVRDSAS